MTEQQSALIVGAGPGLGAALVQRFAAAGMNITATARSAGKAAAVAEAAAATNDSGSEIVGLQADATNEAEVDGLFAAHAARWGAPDVVIYNAGAFMKASIVGATADDFRRCWEANCFGGFIVAKAAAARESSRIAQIEQDIRENGQRVRLLRAEVARLEQPARLESLSRQIGMAPVAVARQAKEGQLTALKPVAAQPAAPAAAPSPAAVADDAPVPTPSPEPAQ